MCLLELNKSNFVKFRLIYKPEVLDSFTSVRKVLGQALWKLISIHPSMLCLFRS